MQTAWMLETQEDGKAKWWCGWFEPEDRSLTIPIFTDDPCKAVTFPDEVTAEGVLKCSNSLHRGDVVPTEHIWSDNPEVDPEYIAHVRTELYVLKFREVIEAARNDKMKYGELVGIIELIKAEVIDEGKAL